jgi:hypothetical protein
MIPGVSCPIVAASLGAAGLGTVCQAVSGAVGSGGTGVAGAVGTVGTGVAGAAGSILSQAAGFGVGSVLDALGSWVSAGATFLLAQLGSVLGATTAIDLGASWFTAHYGTMAALAGVIIVPLLLLGIVQAIVRQSTAMLLRSVLMNVPLAILLTAVAVKLVALGLAVTDAMSAAVSRGAGLDAGHFLGTVTLALSGGSPAGQPSAPGFVLFLGGVAVVFGALMVWIELLLRSAAVYVAVLFLPLALASLAWPSIAHWCRRLVDTLVALVLGKFVIVAVLSLASGALAGGTGSTPAGAHPSAGAPGGGFAAVLGGAALLLLAAFAPWALFRLLPFLEAGAVGHLEGLSHRARQTATAPVKSLAHAAMSTAAAGSLAGAAAGSMGRATGATGSTGGALSPGGSIAPEPGGGPRPGGGQGPDDGPGPGGEGPPSTRPDPPPSSAESTGVGTVDSPGHGIPAWAVHEEATAIAEGRVGPGAYPAARDGLASGEDTRSGAGAEARLGPVAAGRDKPPTRPLPRQTGALHADTLGHDRLGPRLIAAPTVRPPVIDGPTPRPLPSALLPAPPGTDGEPDPAGPTVSDGHGE